MAPPLSLLAAGVEVVLLDIEGTTTPISFVHDRLFPYARARVATFLEQHVHSDEEIQRIVAELQEQQSEPAVDIVSFIHWLIDHDRKVGPLKALQGRIWQEGYATGELKGEVYRDVPPAFARWTGAGVRVAIFSSGSVLAQQLLFANAAAGDLSPYISAYFDTQVGAKSDPASYRRMAELLELSSPPAALFISDVVSELDAARAAGMQTRLCLRPAARPVEGSGHPIIESLDAIAR